MCLFLGACVLNLWWITFSSDLIPIQPKQRAVLPWPGLATTFPKQLLFSQEPTRNGQLVLLTAIHAGGHPWKCLPRLKTVVPPPFTYTWLYCSAPPWTPAGWKTAHGAQEPGDAALGSGTCKIVSPSQRPHARVRHASRCPQWPHQLPSPALNCPFSLSSPRPLRPGLLERLVQQVQGHHPNEAYHQPRVPFSQGPAPTS